MKYLVSVACFFSVIVFSDTAFGQLRLPAIISSGMVLQQNESVNLWGWAGPGDKVYVSNSWDSQVDSAITTHGARWQLKIKTPAAGGPFTISIRSHNTIVLNDVMIGEVWVCSGQSNMEMSYSWGEKDIASILSTAANKNIRFFHIPRTTSESEQDDVKAQWTICDSNTVKTFSAVCYFFGRKLEETLHVPVGLINATWGGTPAEAWAPAGLTNGDSVLQAAATKLSYAPGWPIEPGAAYNGMIAPITNYGIAGAIWYQGEGNTGNSATYEKLFTGMIDSWRTLWKRDFPFYYVQIAPFKYGSPYAGALIQEQQSLAQSHHRVGMVVTTDQIDSVTNIHPTHKREVGYRLANWALADNYHQAGITYKSPVLKSVEKKSGNLVLAFDNAEDGLMGKS